MANFIDIKKQSIFIMILFFSICLNSQLIGQTWINALSGNLDSLNFFIVQKDFYKYWEEKEQIERFNKKDAGECERKKENEEEEEGVITQFQRWEHYWENRIKPDGSFPKPINLGEKRKLLLTQQVKSSFSESDYLANWNQYLTPNTNVITPARLQGL